MIIISIKIKKKIFQLNNINNNNNFVNNDNNFENNDNNNHEIVDVM